MVNANHQQWSMTFRASFNRRDQDRSRMLYVFIWKIQCRHRIVHVVRRTIAFRRSFVRREVKVLRSRIYPPTNRIIIIRSCLRWTEQRYLRVRKITRMLSIPVGTVRVILLRRRRWTRETVLIHLVETYHRHRWRRNHLCLCRDHLVWLLRTTMTIIYRTRGWDVLNIRQAESVLEREQRPRTIPIKRTRAWDESNSRPNQTTFEKILFVSTDSQENNTSIFDYRSCWPRQFFILHFDKQRRVMLGVYASCLGRRNDGWQNWLLSDSIRL